MTTSGRALGWKTGVVRHTLELVIGSIVAGAISLGAFITGGSREVVPAAAAPVPAARALYTDAPSGMYLLDAGWSTRADPRDVGLRDRWQSPAVTRGFRPVAIPNAFNARDLSRSSFRGRVQWYRVRFSLPDASGATGWNVRFESVNVAARVWLNGTPIGSHRGAYLPFELPLSGVRPGENEIVVRVDSRGSSGDLPPANRPRGWWNFGGILREVYLRKLGEFDLGPVQVTAPAASPAVVRVRAAARNDSGTPAKLDYRISASGPGGFVFSRDASAGTVAPGTQGAIDESFTIPNPQLWAPSHPALYRVVLTVAGGQTIPIDFGVRSWSLRNGHVLLNGKPLQLRGASFHEQTPARGAALTPADRSQIVRQLQAIGANATRAHYPPHPALLEAFDRAGIVFWEEIPVWRVRGAQLASGSYRARALSTLRQAVLRDRNHASVLAWSAENETLRGGRGERDYLRAARSLTRSLDPGRFLAVAQAVIPVRAMPTTYRLVDLIGLNDYVGWYGGRTSELRGDLAYIRTRFPHQGLVVTEVGAEASRRGSASVRGTYGFQRNFLRDHLGVFDQTHLLSGALVWALRDFAVRPGWSGGNPRPRPPWSFKGLFRRDGSAKPAEALVRNEFLAHRAG